MNLSVSLLTTSKQLFDLREEWEALLKCCSERDYYFSYDWFYPLMTYCSKLPRQLVVFVFRKGNDLQAIFPCTLSKVKKRFLKVKVLGLYGNLYNPRRGGLVREGNEHFVAEAFVDYLLGSFSDEWDMIDFHGLSRNDKVVCALTDVFDQKQISYNFIRQFKNIRTIFDGYQSESFFASLSKTLRQNIRSGINRFTRNGQIVVWLIQNELQDIAAAVSDYYEIYNDSWKEKELEPDFHGKLALYLARRQKARLFILYFKQASEETGMFNRISTVTDDIYFGNKRPPDDYVPIATIFFVVDEGKVYFLKTAYRTNYSKFSPGMVLFWFAVKHSIDIDHCEMIDHQIGSEPYKLRWGHFYEMRFCLLAENCNSFKGRWEMWGNTKLVPLYRKVKRISMNLVNLFDMNRR